jgi:hypothetical protein
MDNAIVSFLALCRTKSKTYLEVWADVIAQAANSPDHRIKIPYTQLVSYHGTSRTTLQRIVAFSKSASSALDVAWKKNCLVIGLKMGVDYPDNQQENEKEGQEMGDMFNMGNKTTDTQSNTRNDGQKRISKQKMGSKSSENQLKKGMNGQKDNLRHDTISSEKLKVGKGSTEKQEDIKGKGQISGRKKQSMGSQSAQNQSNMFGIGQNEFLGIEKKSINFIEGAYKEFLKKHALPNMKEAIIQASAHQICDMIFDMCMKRYENQFPGTTVVLDYVRTVWSMVLESWPDAYSKYVRNQPSIQRIAVNFTEIVTQLRSSKSKLSNTQHRENSIGKISRDEKFKAALGNIS